MWRGKSFAWFGGSFMIPRGTKQFPRLGSTNDMEEFENNSFRCFHDPCPVDTSLQGRKMLPTNIAMKTLALGYLLVIELNLCYCMAQDEVGLCSAPLFPSCVLNIPGRLAKTPPHQPCVGQETTMKTIRSAFHRAMPSLSSNG